MSVFAYQAMTASLLLTLAAGCLATHALLSREAHLRRLLGEGHAAPKSPRSPWAAPVPLIQGWALGVLLCGLGLVVGLALGRGGGAALGLAGGAGATLLVRALRFGRARAQLRRDFTAFLRDVHLATTAGELALGAVRVARDRTTGPLRAWLDQVVAGCQAGASLHEAFVPPPLLRGASEHLGLWQALTLHADTGCSLSELLMEVVDEADRARLRRDELAAKAADARGSARILALVPVALVLYLSLWDRWALAPLLEEPAGRVGFVAGVLLWASGILLVWRLQVPPYELGERGRA